MWTCARPRCGHLWGKNCKSFPITPVRSAIWSIRWCCTGRAEAGHRFIAHGLLQLAATENNHQWHRPFGVLRQHQRERDERHICDDQVHQFAHIILKMVGYVMNFAPVGVFGAISAVVANYGLQDIVYVYLKFFGAFLLGKPRHVGSAFAELNA